MTDSAGARDDLEDALDRLQASRRDGSGPVLDDALAAFGARVFGPLILIPALIAILSAIGGAPGVSEFCAALTMLVSACLALSGGRVRLPRSWGAARLSGDPPLEALRPWFRRIGAVFEPRLEIFWRPALLRLLALLCFLLGLMMLAQAAPGGGGIAAPAAALLLLSLALATHDGLILLFGLVIAAAALFGGWSAGGNLDVPF